MEKHKRTFFKTSIVVTVLSEGAPVSDGSSLESIAAEMYDGDLVGTTHVRSQKRLGRKQVVRELYEVGSDSSFFGLTSEGKDT